MSGLIRLEIDGNSPTPEQLYHAALVNYGHLTAMQVRSGAVQGLPLHLERLASASKTLFGAELDGDRVRSLLAHAVRDVADCSLRVHVLQPAPEGPLSVLVATRPPSVPPPSVRYMRVPYERPVAGVKHLGSFGQIHHGRAAVRAGFDDALLTTPDGEITEGAIHNVAFFDGTTLHWPSAPSLAGITMQLLQPLLSPSRMSPVYVHDLGQFTAAFASNSIGLTPITQIDAVAFPVSEPLMSRAAAALSSIPWIPLRT